MPGDLAVVIPARNEVDRIGATVRAAARLPGADLIVVVDEGSSDGTAAAARQRWKRARRPSASWNPPSWSRPRWSRPRTCSSSSTPTWATVLRRPGRWPGRSGTAPPT
jgi:hypothetical protein